MTGGTAAYGLNTTHTLRVAFNPTTYDVSFQVDDGTATVVNIPAGSEPLVISLTVGLRPLRSQLFLPLVSQP